jgi:hypothetical protein
VRVLRNAYCPRTVLRVYAQHLSAGRSGLALLGSGHDRSRRWGSVLDVNGRVRFQKGESDDALGVCSWLATSPDR